MGGLSYWTAGALCPTVIGMETERTAANPYPHLPKWVHCHCGQPVRHEYTRWCAEHDPNRHRPTPWYLWPVYLPLAALAIFLILAFMGVMERTMPY